MHVEKGKYYRDGNGRVIGPLMYTGDGEFLHLVAEVYVSDTPPANAPAPEAKTLRDEFAMAALTVAWEYAKRGSQSNLTITTTSRLAYAFADEMMEARKK